MRKEYLIYVILDIIVVTLSFLILIWYKPASRVYYLPNYTFYFFIFLGIWISFSILIGKFSYTKKTKPRQYISSILFSNLAILTAVMLAIFYFHISNFSRSIVLGTILLATFLELFLTWIFVYFRNLKKSEAHDVLAKEERIIASETKLDSESSEDSLEVLSAYKGSKYLKNIISELVGLKVFNFFKGYLNREDAKNLVIATTTRFNIDTQPENQFETITNLKRLNDVRYLNKFFESINDKLPFGGYFCGFVETKNERKERILRKYPPILNFIFYVFDFIIRRVLPKLRVTRKLYFFITKGHNRVISRSETLGRLYSCGFKIVKEDEIKGFFHFVVQKVGEPDFNNSASYGPFFKMKRVGKNGKIIYVYKVRTMHAFSEYLQEYVYQKNNLSNNGKFHNDFRITTLGRFMRKFWIDELPMIFNVFKGELKIVGVRPLSTHYYNLYPQELKDQRIKFKPGLVPPYYADMPKSFEEILDSERRYLERYKKRPFITDIRYFFTAFFNIFFKKARSG